MDTYFAYTFDADNANRSRCPEYLATACQMFPDHRASRCLVVMARNSL
jgi:hypothetical protein